MITIKKSEWHQVERQYEIQIDEEVLGEIYPDLEEADLEQMLQDLENGVVLPETIVEASFENSVELYWEHVDDDWWTDRKGGYDVTYSID